MKVKLHMLSVGVLFFIGQGLIAQKKNRIQLPLKI